MDGMTSLLNELEKHLTVRITNVVVKDDHIEFFLDDRRIISFPLRKLFSPTHLVNLHLYL